MLKFVRNCELVIFVEDEVLRENVEQAIVAQGYWSGLVIGII